ncbi:MAG: metallophosphoesterase [Aigarchaeota archaeon]|nr:metallophosphoesterase [Aigarchaeota archaeon]MCX8192200.1 metallophosphoesterase [Nitrososphaeria archaeon]MDW7986194.1 metallophosphoesterase [Nitrososphaerota archaeon]
MRILHVSDIHGNMAAVEKIVDKSNEFKVSLVVVTGDLTHFGEVEDAETILEKISQSGRDVFFVPGNCDPRALLRWSPVNPHIKNLHLNSVEYMGREFIGLGGAVGSYGTLIEFTEEEVEEALKSIAPLKSGFIFVSHSPPYGLEIDYTGVKHIGSKAVKKFIELHHPKLVLCGHAHEGRGIVEISGTVVVNSGPAKNGYCSIVEVGEDVEVQLTMLY